MLLLLAIFAASAAVVMPVGRLHTFLFSVLAVSAVVLPKALSANSATQYVGIATRSPTLYTFSVMAFVFGVWIVLRHLRTFLLGLAAWLPFLVLTVIYWQQSWPNDPITRSGMLQVSTGIAIFALSYTATRAGVIGAATFARILMFCVAIQAMAVLSDLAGAPIYTSRVASVDGAHGRVVGFTSHAEVLAQIILISMAGILCHEPEKKAEQVIQWCMAATCLAIIALTLGRTAFAAAVFTLVLFALLQPGVRGRRTRAVLITTAFVASLFAASSLIARFHEDPTGGDRTYLNNVALAAIHTMPPSGLGLNQYVNVVGSYDPLVGSGVPVHNAFLLLVAETGYVAGILFWLPLLLMALKGWRARKNSGPGGAAARIMVASIPAVLLISYEGWSLPSTQIFEVFALVYGGLLGLVSLAKKSGATASAAGPYVGTFASSQHRSPIERPRPTEHIATGIRTGGQ